MRVITVQTRGAVRRLEQQGTLTGDGRRTDHHFRPAYTVIRRWLAAHDPTYRGTPYPVWGWALPPDGDIREILEEVADTLAASQRNDPPSVVLSATVDDERVLRTCATCWHAVLNGHPATGDPHVVAAWEHWLDTTPQSRLLHPAVHAPQPLRRLLDRDWRHIIDQRCGCDPDLLGHVTFARLHLSDVVAAVPLTAGDDPERLAAALIAASGS